MINQLFVLPLSLLGFLFGIILALIAPEELRPGKKYFLLIKKILFCFILLLPLFLFIYLKNYYFVLIIIIYLVLYFLILRKKKFWLKEIFNYSFFIITYLVFIILNLKNNLIIILPSLIFLYGLPAGTLFRLSLIEKQEKLE